MVFFEFQDVPLNESKLEELVRLWSDLRTNLCQIIELVDDDLMDFVRVGHLFHAELGTDELVARVKPDFDSFSFMGVYFNGFDGLAVFWKAYDSRNKYEGFSIARVDDGKLRAVSSGWYSSKLNQY